MIGVARKPSEAFAAAAAAPPEAARCGSRRSTSAMSPPFLNSYGRSQRHGPLYGLVNNAGVGAGGLLANLSNDDIEATLRLNTLAPIVLTKYVARGMMAAGRGRIVNIASIVAATGYSGLSVYSASKAALDRLHSRAGARSSAGSASPSMRSRRASSTPS